MTTWDITPLVTPQFPLWPGSVPLKRTVQLDMGKGDGVTVSSFTATAHLGAHADAPSPQNSRVRRQPRTCHFKEP